MLKNYKLLTQNILAQMCFLFAIFLYYLYNLSR